MRPIRLLAATLLVAALSACATGIGYTEYQPKIPALGADVGRIYFYRPSALGAAIRPDVLLNNDKVGEAIAHGFFYVDRSPGNYEVTTTTEVKRTLSLVLEKGQTRYVRFSISLGFFAGHVYGELVEPDVGLAEIQDCKYTGGKE